jgi:CRP/FNR family transcriptional regulator, dissimilatory nitrate respiration regulator
MQRNEPVADWGSVVAAVPLLERLPGPARKQSHIRILSAGQTLFRRGGKPDAMYAVLSGEMRLVRASARGAEIVLQRARSGFLAEASFDQPAYHCDAVASADARTLVIPRAAFEAALAERAFMRVWIVHLARELRNVRAIAERISLKTAQERIVHFIETEGRDGVFELTCSKKDWAAELGLTHEALYRELASMRHRRELVTEGATLRLCLAASG